MQESQPQPLTNREFIELVLKGLEASIEPLPCEAIDVDGAYCLRFELDCGPGTVSVIVKPHRILQWSLERGAATAEDLLQRLTAGTDDPGEDDPAHKGEALASFAKALAIMWIAGIYDETRCMLAESELAVECILKGTILRTAGVRTDDGPKRLAQSMARARQDWLNLAINFYGQRDFSAMRSHYEELLPLAKEAKQVFKQNQRRNWHGMIEQGYPEFDIDVIDLFSDGSDETKLPAVITKNFTTPADIALLQAARRCGMQGFECTSPRTLRDWMEKGAAVNLESAAVSPDRPVLKIRGDQPM